MAYKRLSKVLTSNKVTTSASVAPAPKLTATGGVKTTVGSYTVHTFLTSDTFTVTTGQNAEIEYLIVAGGAGGGGDAPGTNGHSGGGGAGGFLESYAGQTLGADFSGQKIYVNGGDVFTITVGAGGAKGVGSVNRGGSGGNSSIVKSGAYSVIAIGGGGGGAGGNGSAVQPGSGGSAGGTYYPLPTPVVPGEAVISPRQGYRAAYATGFLVGGAGAGGTGDTNVPPTVAAPGRVSSISGTSVTYAAGNLNSDTATPNNGATNKGNGGGGGSQTSGVCGTGGSGIVIIRYLT